MRVPRVIRELLFCTVVRPFAVAPDTNNLCLHTLLLLNRLHSRPYIFYPCIYTSYPHLLQLTANGYFIK